MSNSKFPAVAAATAVFVLAFLLAGSTGLALPPSNRYALVLQDSPVSSRFVSRESIHSAAANSYRQQIESRQRSLRNELSSRKFQVLGSVSTLANAVFVLSPPDRVAELKSLPGVQDVVPLRRYKRNLNRAAGLIDAPAAWVALGGVQNAGAGIKIAILDSGIDQTHPAFQDPTLPMPAGFPICSGADCSFTNNKVIAARSYVRQLAAGTSPANPAADSRPDDYSARDRDGHGTAVASCAAGVTNTGAVTITGIAPRAYLGNYKIYGSPEVNDFTSDDVIIQALDDAVNDGMDIVSFSSGGPAFSGPLDTGAVCGNNAGVPCDLVAQAFENAVQAGTIIVAAAGNEGDTGRFYPTFGSASSPADAPSVIAAGATTNSHFFVGMVSLAGAAVPSNLQSITAQPGDSFAPAAASAPLVDVTQLGNDGLACVSLPGGSLNGSFALIERGTCNFSAKMSNAQQAGAAGVIFYMADSSTPIAPGGLSGFNIPGVMISNSDGLALKSFVDSNPGQIATIDSNGMEQAASVFNQLASFSSRGPSTGDSALKPDLVAVGTSVYMAVESYDPLGMLFSSNGYAAADGTSFATPMTSGAAALVKQAHPSFTAAQVKSALVNTTTQDVTTDDSGNPVGIQSVGAGKLDVAAAVAATITATPATLSFGQVRAGVLPVSRQLQIVSANAVTLSISALNQTVGTSLTLDKQSLPAGGGIVTVTLSGSVPPAGSYSGAVLIQGAGGSIRVPFLYLVATGSPANIIPLIGDGFDGTVGQTIPDGAIVFRLVDVNGLPVTNAPVSFTARNGGTLQNVSTTTDNYGIAGAVPILGPQPGTYSFTAVGGGISHTFTGSARPMPTIPPNGIVNAASFDSTVAPGSYISIFGTGLSDTTDSTFTVRLPLAIDFATVSFDVPSAKISVPGHLVYVSPTQVNLQVPWELQGQTSAQVKVTIDFSNGNVVTIPISNYAPAFFEVGAGQVAALDTSFKVVGASNPIPRGQAVQLFVNGLGPVTNQPASGDPAPMSPLSETTVKPVVTIGGQTATVQFSGLAPGFAGLYQVNVVVPQNVTPGNNAITIAIGGQTSKASGIVVQ